MTDLVRLAADVQAAAIGGDLLAAEYSKHREQGHAHHGAIKALARRFDLDKATVGRVIERAERLERGASTPTSGATPAAVTPAAGTRATHQGGRSKSFSDTPSPPRSHAFRARCAEGLGD